MKQMRKHLTYSNVMSTIAVFLLLGGGAALAAGKLGKNTVGTKQLKKEAVTAAKIKAGTVSGDKLADNAVTTAKIADNAVTTGKIPDNAVTTGKLAINSVSTPKISDNSVTTAKLTNASVTQPKVATDAIGSSQFKDLIVRTGEVVLTTGNSGFASAACLADEQVISAGTHWSEFENGLYTNYIRILGNGVQGRGNNFSGSTRTFFVDAYCLAS